VFHGQLRASCHWFGSELRRQNHNIETHLLSGQSENTLMIRRFWKSIRAVTVSTLEDLTELYFLAKADKQSLQERH
jgi:hypothetical protein